MKKRGNLNIDEIKKISKYGPSEMLISILQILNEKIIPHMSDIENGDKRSLIDLRHNLSDIIFISKVLKDNSSIKLGRKFKNEIGNRIREEEQKVVKSTNKLLSLSKLEVEARMLQHVSDRKNGKIKEGEEESNGINKEAQNEL